MNALDRMIEFAPLGSDNLVVLANMIANELNTIGEWPSIPDEISEYVSGLHVAFDTITSRLVVINCDEPDFLSNNVICPIE